MSEVKPEENDDGTNKEEKPSSVHEGTTRLRLNRQSVVEWVEEKQSLTLSFEHLSVHVPEIKPSWYSRNNCAKEYLGVEANEGYHVLQDVSGYLNQGEMVLVLSSNEQSSSTLIQTLTGRHQGFGTSVSGGVFINGVSLPNDKSVLRRYRRMAPYVSASDATHAAVLTVRETLQFAAECVMSNERREDRVKLKELVDEVLEMLDLTHVADTVVGDENLRGISGGQKRRVTVGEMMKGEESAFLGLENITDGLSSLDSLNLIQLVSDICRLLKLSAVVSLLQPSDEIVNMFDKVLVLSNDGHLNYFGPISRVLLREIFLGPEADPSLDSGSICDLVLNQQLMGDEEQDEIQQRFQKSIVHQDMVDRLAEIRFQVQRSQRQDIHQLIPKEKYASNWFYQLRFICRRRLKLIVRNAVTYTRLCIAIVFGLIIGSLFSELGYDIAGSLSRTGYLFLHCFLVLMLSAAVTIPGTFRERVTLFKHRQAEFYSGRVAYVAQILLDIPLSIVEAALLASISYFWVGLQKPANHFFYFLGVLIGLEFVGQAFGRFLCAVCRMQVYANSLSSIFLLIFGTVAGFMPGYSGIPPVLRWLSWVTPASYAFEGAMLNEFVGRDLDLVSLSTDAGPIDATMSGESWLSLMSLPRKNWDSWGGLKAFDIIMLFILAFILDLFGCYYTERSRSWYFGKIHRPQRTTIAAIFERNKSDLGESNGNSTPDASSKTAGGESKVSFNEAREWPKTLTIREISYFVPLKRKPLMRCSIHSLLEPCLVACYGKKNGEESVHIDNVDNNELQLLSEIDGKFKSGRMCALMGTSGAGKTTLLDVVAGYKTGGRISGDILLDGCQKETDVWKTISSYAEQSDILNPYLSVLETLRFTAACRLPSSVEKEAVIQKILNLVALEDWADMIIGREKEGEGLPKHARRRLTIANSIVTLPKILFADEPTTGLGTSSAALVMEALRRCTNEMQLITVATIHQPSKNIWDSFDDFLLLVKGGKTAYFGEMGRDSHTVLNYFSTLSKSDPPHQANPADYVLSVVGSLPIEEVCDYFKQSKTYETLQARVNEAEGSAVADGSDAMKEIRKELTKSRFKEFLFLTKRHYMTQWRNPSYSMMRLASSCLVSLYMGILFIGEKDEVQGAIYTIGSIFFLVFVLVIPMQSSVVPLVADRAVLYRENTSGLYSRFSYGLGQLAADIPFHVLNALIMLVCFYFLVGFRVEIDLIGYFFLMLILANWALMSLGQLYALASPNEESANGIAGLTIILSVITMGFLLVSSMFPSYWLWAYWTNLFHYMIQGLVTNELAGNKYTLLEPTSALDFNATLNVSNILAFEPGTDVSDGSAASQAANFMGLATKALPGSNPDWNNSGIVAVASLLQCNVDNDCLKDPIIPSFIECNIICGIFCTTPCKDEFDFAMDTINFTAIDQCFDILPPLNETSSEVALASFSDIDQKYNVPAALELGEDDQLEFILCLLAALLPPGVPEAIVELLKLVEQILDVLMIVIDILEQGIKIPGEVILWVFGWAEWTDGKLEAPFKWWYCMFAVAMFLVGIEFFKLLAVCFIVWTKR